MADLVWTMPLRGTVARAGHPLSADPEAVDLTRAWLDCGRRNIRPAGSHGCGPELGLPRYLDAGCLIHDLRLHAARASGGSRAFSRLGGRAPPEEGTGRALAHHVRDRRERDTR